jgi:myo-inositol-1(or 4)-monophosphatase
MEDAALLATLYAAADAVHDALERVQDWGPSGLRPGQYAADLVADDAVRSVLLDAGLGVFSEESGSTEASRELVVVVDPIDGSTNAAHGIPWFSTSLCVVDAQGPRVALVANQATGVRYEACRGGGALRDGKPIEPSGCTSLGAAVVAVSGLPPRSPGWAQFRAFGACSLDLCAVADGMVDGYRTVGGSWVYVWDYLGALLVCREAGADVRKVSGAALHTVDGSRRRPVSAATAQLADQLAKADV